MALPHADAAGTDAAARSITGTAWAVDARTGETVVTADSTVQDAEWDSLLAATRGSAVRVVRTPRVLRLFAEGGDAIFTGGPAARSASP
nr:alpha-lytic protease prodomain-containing protein [Amycolatopsis sp. CA-128772]